MIPAAHKDVNWFRRSAWAMCLTFGGLAVSPAVVNIHAQNEAASSETAKAEAMAPGVPFTAAQLNSMLPATVYFAGRTAPLQLRNSGGVKFANGTILWVGLVDSSGYSTGVQERYQFYLVAEGPVRVGDIELHAGAYGGGFAGGQVILMDLGDHTIGQGATQTDAALQRPRPLQLVGDGSNAAKLYLGRKWVGIQAASH